MATALGAFMAAGVALALTACARSLLAGGGPAQVDVVVEIAVVGVGALVAAWLALSAALATVCLVVRLVGATWRTGERAVHQFAPAVVRRALVVAVTAGLGAGLAPSAYAADGAPTPTASASVTVEASGLDLGWVVTAPTTADATATAPAAGATGTGAPALDDAPATDAVVARDEANPDHDTTTAGRSRPELATPAPSATPHAPATSTPHPTAAQGTIPAAGPTARVGTVDDAGEASRPTSPAPSAAGRTRAADAPTSATVVVHRGDSLWRIAERHLPAGADAATVAAAWPAWYDANRAAIGDDPGLLLPGQVLVVPDGVAR